MPPTAWLVRHLRLAWIRPTDRRRPLGERLERERRREMHLHPEPAFTSSSPKSSMPPSV
jgi:hypothetical protein